MRYVTLGVVVWCLIGVPVSGQAQDVQVVAPIKKFIDSFNKGDMAGAAATHAADADLAIMDEVPPYLWRGAQAFKGWSADLEADAKKRGMTEPVVTIKAPTRIESSADQAYVVVPAVFTFKEARCGDAGSGADDVRAEEGRQWLVDPRMDVDGTETSESDGETVARDPSTRLRAPPQGVRV